MEKLTKIIKKKDEREWEARKWREDEGRR